MLAIVGLFTIGNSISALAPTYFILIIGRILTGFAHGTFFAIATKLLFNWFLKISKRVRLLSCLVV